MDDPWWRHALAADGVDDELVGAPTAYAALEGSPGAAPEPEPPGRDSPESELPAEVPPEPEPTASAAPESEPERAAPISIEEALARATTSLDHQLFGGQVAEPAGAVAEVAGVAEPAEATRVVEDVDSEPEVAEPAGVVDIEAAAATAADAALRAQIEMETDGELRVAEQSAHEDARMWAAVSAARAAHDELLEAASRLEARQAEQRAAREALAAEARAIDEARMKSDEARRRTEDEMRTALAADFSGPEANGPKAATELTDADINTRFRAIAAQLEASDSAISARRARREELRLHTSLVVLDAEHPWDAGGWSRPGSFLNRGGAGRSPPQRPPGEGIAAASDAGMAESSPGRRWPWSRKRRAAEPRNDPQDRLRSLLVIEERSMSNREDELGEDRQEPLPFDLEAWSDEGWEFPEDEASTPEAESPDATSTPDDDGDDEDEGDDWESFTAERYVQTATQDYVDLAAAVAAADAEVPEQAAVAADMPGMESSLVGLEDVVEAEGMDVAEAAPRSDLTVRVLTALGLVTLFFASLTYKWSIGVLVLVVMTLAAGEISTVLVRQHRHPVTLFTYLGTLAALLGTWIYGPVAIPVAVTVTLLVVMLYFGLVTGRQDPMVGMALTVLVVLWVGVLAAFAMDMVRATEYRWLIGSLVVIVALMDVAQYFVGKRFGKRLLAPVVSPRKTVAGLMGGVIASVAAGYGLSFIAPYDATTGIVLGAALAATGPIGDLAMSVLKRSLDVKDMGSVLPGHGGVADRIDAILFALPAAWIVYAWAGMLV